MNLLFTLLGLCLTISGLSQKAFIKQAQIRFERKENMYFLMKDDQGLEEYKRANPQFNSAYFDLIFDTQNSIYLPALLKDEGTKNIAAGAIKKTFYSLTNCRYISQKEAYGQSYIVDDSCKNIRWKLVNEKRVIAGFECKRANAIILDSIYVVAFYTEEITPSVGPESFSGLPGAILGVVLPHKHVSWFATNVSVNQVNKSLLVAPQEGRKVTAPELIENLRSNIGSQDRYLDHFLMLLLL